MSSSEGRTASALSGTSYIALAIVMAAIAVGGFWGSYWGPLFSGELDLHWLLHLHGVVFTAWLGLLVTQAVLVYRGRLDIHRSLGAYLGVSWGVLMIVVGMAAGFGTISPAIGNEFESLSGFVEALAIPLGDILLFGGLFAAGIHFRRRPELHKRLMIIATAALLFAPTGRLGGVLFSSSPTLGLSVALGLPLVPVALAAGNELRIRRAIHPVYLVGLALLMLNGARLQFNFNSRTWEEMAAAIAEALRGVLVPLL